MGFRAVLKALRLFSWLVAAGSLLVGPAVLAAAVTPPPAPTPAASPCDPQYSQSLSARAWLEAQREVTQNQNLIYKPDSVLEYTCFNSNLSVLAGQASSMFSESSRWGSSLGNTHMDTALTQLVGNAVNQYISANFENSGAGTYDLLGGRFNDTGTNATNLSPANLDHAFTGNITGGGYNCSIMNQVWLAAKCIDFIANQNNDGFYTFANYQASQDRRFLPRACTAIGARWDLTMRESTGINTPWTEDSFLTFVESFRYLQTSTTPASQGCNHVRPVPTGMTVYSREFNNYAEHVCLAPGCYYRPPAGGGAGLGSCQRSQ